MNKKIAFHNIIFYFCILFAAPGHTQQPATENRKNTELYSQLPDEIKKQGKITSAFDGAYPPYVIIKDGKTEGVAIDLAQALSQELGVSIGQQVVGDFTGLLSGLQMGRYQFAMGPISARPERHDKVDFINYIHEYEALILPRGNPHNIHSLKDMCGKRVGALSGGYSIHNIETQSQECVKQGKAAITVQTYPDSATALLAVRSGRSDAALDSAAVLSFYAQQTVGEFELIPADTGNIIQGMALPKNSPLTPVIHAAMQKLFENGTYAAIMKKWHLEGNMLPAPGVNLSANKAVKADK